MKPALTAAVLVTLLAACAVDAASVRLFGKADHPYELPAAEFTNYLFVGALRDSAHPDDTLCFVLNLGFDFPLVDFALGRNATVGLGVAPLFHLYMFPRESVFHNDNYYAVLSIYLAGTVGSHLAWRLYPIYHISAHLGDGAPLVHGADRPAVSNEMVYLTLATRWVKGLEVLLGSGIYYHAVTRKQMDGILNGACLYEYPLLRSLSVFGALDGHLIFEDGVRAGGALRTGLRFRGSSGRRADVALRWFSRPHKGQYHADRERGIGCSIEFCPSLGRSHDATPPSAVSR